MKVAVPILLLLAFVCSTFEKSPHKEDEREHYHDYIKRRSKAPPKSVNEQELTAEYWNNNAKQTVDQRLNFFKHNGVAKNVIMFLGDGMSIATLAAARTHLGQRDKKSGEETFLSFEKFPYTGLSKTYCVDRQVADSACSATAYLCGVKANEGTIGVTAAVGLSDCEAMNDKKNHVYSIGHLAQLAKKRTGLVTTTRVTHASPAGIYAHTANRDWESNVEVEAEGKNPDECLDIARQLTEGDTGSKLNVIFGGGRSYFLPKDANGWRTDNRNLIEDWEKSKENTIHKYIQNLEELKELDEKTEYVLGLFNADHMEYNLDRKVTEQPSLQEMTDKAIKILSRGKNGFVLFVEGGRIDHAHHETRPRKALDETIEFHKAIEAAVVLTNPKDTLIVVTSDHSHTMTVNGYPERGNDILNIGGMGDDRLPYTSLSYANGPSAAKNAPRKDVTNDKFDDKDYQHPSYVYIDKETHAGEDVAIFASGPWAHLFTGVTEQNAIAHLIHFAACIGDYSDCKFRSSSQKTENLLILTLLSVAVALLRKHVF